MGGSLISIVSGCLSLWSLQICPCMHLLEDTSTSSFAVSNVKPCMQGGNDYEIFMSSKTKGHSVTSPKDTEQQCTEIFIKPLEQKLAA